MESAPHSNSYCRSCPYKSFSYNTIFWSLLYPLPTNTAFCLVLITLPTTSSCTLLRLTSISLTSSLAQDRSLRAVLNLFPSMKCHLLISSSFFLAILSVEISKEIYLCKLRDSFSSTLQPAMLSAVNIVTSIISSSHKGVGNFPCLLLGYLWRRDARMCLLLSSTGDPHRWDFAL